MTITNYVQSLGVQDVREYAEKNPDMMGDSSKMNHYVFTLTRGSKRFKFNFSAGVAVNPTVQDLIACLIRDYDTNENYGAVDLSEEFGYSMRDSIKLKKSLEKNGAKISTLFSTGEIEVLKELAEDF